VRPRITLVAQGTSRGLRQATFGARDGLDEGGRRGAEALRGRLGRVDRAFASPAPAAQETAALMGLEAEVEERLRDCDYGRWEGRSFAQVVVREPRRLMGWMKDPATAPHGGESIPEVLARAAAWIADLSRLDGHTVAVTHSAVIRAAVVHAIEADIRAFWRIDIVPLSLTDLRTNGRRWALRSLGVVEAREGED
jgi:broad specificity phosphatase PhoE